MRINTNVSALSAHRNLSKTGVNLGKSIERLSSGLRINRAGDDAAGLVISEKLRLSPLVFVKAFVTLRTASASCRPLKVLLMKCQAC